MRQTWWLVIVMVACGSKPEVRPPEVRFEDPATTLIAQEQDVWSLEGQLLAEADRALRAGAARAALGDATALVRASDAEARVRAYLREHRSAELRALGTAFLDALDAPTRQVLAAVAERTELDEADVFMDYLTHEAVYDLAIMRLGYKRWKGGRFATHPEAEALAASFFAETDTAPSAARGIRVVKRDGDAIVLDVFGGRVHEEVTRVEVEDSVARGRVAQLDWTSNYEQLRRMSRGEPRQDSYREAMAWDGTGYRVSYAVELDEYLTWNAQNPWAAMLYALSVDEVADLYAGAAAAGGLEVGAAASAAEPERLPEHGAIGGADHGVAVSVVEARFAPTLAGLQPRRGQFAIVTLEISSTLDDELRAPSAWFTLAAGDAEYPELGVTRPGLGAALLTVAPPGARMLALPFTAIGAAPLTLVLVYDVPADVTVAALVLGPDELALKVAPRPPEPPTATVVAEAGAVDVSTASAGKLAWVARAGASVAAGDPIAKLRGHRAVEAALAAARRKLEAYQRALQTTRGAKRAAVEKKVAEKQALVAARSRDLAALVIAAPASGEVEVISRVGARLRAGAVLARVITRRLIARFVMRDTRSGLAPGAGGCRVAARSARQSAYRCEVVAVTGVRVEVRPAADAPFQPGDQIVLVTEGN